VVFCFATGDHAFERSRFAHNAVTRVYRRWRQNIDLSGNPTPPGMTAAREGLGQCTILYNCSPKEVLRFYYGRKNELRSSP